MEARSGIALVSRFSKLSIAVQLSVAGLLFGGISAEALASCSTIGATVTCSGTPLPLNTFASATNNLTVNVGTGTQMNAVLGGHVLDLTGINITLNNSGTIDPAVLGGALSVLSGGAFIGTVATSTVNVLNNVGGIIRGTGALLGVGLPLTSIEGLAIAVHNAAAGTTSITNNGTITSTGLAIGGVTLADAPVIGVYGGSQVNMTNSNTGTVTGRVAFETSAAGNSFTNAGTINGSVSMGGNSTNTFTAVTNSSVNVGDGVQITVGLGGLINVNLTFAPTGTVDGGASGTNSLILQNPTGVGGDTSGIGTASSATYVNFNNLTINSGTWTLLGPLVSGATTLNGGVAQFNNNATFGSGVLTSNGGIIEASNAGLNVSNLISLGAGGMTVRGTNDTTLSGVISGSGGLTKVDAGQLNLSAANTYLGNTTLNGGIVQLGNNLALSTGTLNFIGATSLSAPGTISLNNAISLGGTMTATGAGALTLGGLISGSSGITKTGIGSLKLAGANTGYTGTTTLSAGSLLVTNNNSLGSGALTTAAGTGLDSTANVTLANNVGMTGVLNTFGSNALTLSGVLTGTGGIAKFGSARLTLSGNNSNSGNTALNGGSLFVGSNTALGTGVLNAATGTTLDATTAVTLANAVALAADLSIGGTQALGLSGVVTGGGNLIKNGTANLTLSGNNTFSGGTALNAGTLIVGSNTALGTGALTTAAGSTLDASTTVALTNAVSLGGNLNIGGSANLTLGGIVSGSGGLTKNGAANLILNGSNTFLGAIALNAGTVTAGANAALGSGNITVGGAATLDANSAVTLNNSVILNNALTIGGSNGLTLGGVISGVDQLIKNGTANLTLNGANTFSGGSTLNAGSLTVGNGGALGTGALTVAGAGTLNSSSAVTLNNAITLNANLTAGGANALTLGGVISGGNGLTKNGTSSLTLNGTNTYTGTTTLSAGSLIVGSNTALGTGALNAANTTTLDANTAVALANNVNLGGTLTVGGTHALTLGGVVAGAGGLIKSGAADLTLNGANTYLGNTALNTGKLTVGNNTALGSGTLNAAANTTLDANTNVSLNNAVALAGALNIGGSADLTLTGLVSGAGSLVKNGASNLTLNAVNNFIGGTTLNAGTLTVGNSSALSSGALTVGGAATLDSNSPLVNLTNAIVLNAALTIGGTQNLGLAGVISGTSQLTKNGAANLSLNGNNTFSGGTTLNSGTLTLGNTNGLGSGGLIVGGAATLDNSLSFGIGNAITLNAGLTVEGNNDLRLNGIIDGAGSLTKSGLADLTLAGNNSFTGALNILSGSVTTLNTNALGNTFGVNISAGAGLNLGSNASLAGLTGNGSVQLTGSNTLTVGGFSSSSTFDGDLSGSGGLIKVGTGTFNLTGISGISGNTTVNAGTLNLSGSLNSAQVNVNTGGSMTGTGSVIGSLNINNGGHLLLSSGDTLAASTLTLGAGSNVDVKLATPSTASLMNIGGNLTLNGNLNVTDAGGFGIGVYRLFNYTGSLTDLGLDVASVPLGYALGDLVVQTGVANQINIQVSAPNSNIRYWDGSQTNADGVVDGGTGTWNSVGNNWTNANGLANQPWAGDFAVFQGTAGTVTVNGTQLFTGMQLLTDGYNLVSGAAGQLTAVNGTGGTTAVRVDPGVTGTLGVNINGSGILNKLDSGTLVLNGANTYSGGTQLDGGMLVVGSNTALGSGTLTANAGTQLDSNATVTLANAATLNGNLTVIGSNSLTLNGVIGGTGGLIKSGAANLTLGGNNAFLGPVALNAGGLILASNSALGSGTLNAADGTTLDTSTGISLNNAVNLDGNLSIGGTAGLTLAGTVNGAGSLTKNGASNLTLSGNNNFSGGITLNAGTLTTGSNSGLGQGNLTVAGASALDSNSALSLGSNVVLNANLSNIGNNNLTLAGVVSGAGGFVKNGASNLTLNGINTFSGGTTLNAGALTLGNSASIGSGALTVGGAATLDSSSPLVLANTLNVNANLSLAGNNNLTLGGVIAGTGTLTKNGLADVTLSGNNTFGGTFDVLSGSLTTLSTGALGNNATVNLGGGAALNLGASGSLARLTGSGTALIGTGNTLSLGGTNVSSTFAGIFSGDGGLTKLGTGTLTLSGVSDLSGDTNVNAGTLQVNGSLASANVLVNSGGTLGGSGTLTGAVTVADGGHLAGATGSTLSVDSLVFSANSNFDVGLGTPVSGGGNALVNVGGNLTLDGTLNVSDIGGFGSGVYRLINYTGGLTDNGMLIGAIPGSVTAGDLQLQTALANQINLLVSAPGVTVQFWDGNQLIANGSVDGGSGVWGSGTTNWTDVNGTTNQAWTNNFAVFQGAAGTVTVNGAQTITGMQFVTDGYSLQNGTAGSLNLVNGSLGNASVRVDPNATATLGVALNGAGILGKYDTGTLVLNSVNGYTGGTALNGGKLVVGNNAALGTGVLTAADGTALDSNTTVSLGNAVVLNGGLNISGSNALTLGGVISGSGSLIKAGASSLTLNGSNTYSGGTQLNGGALILGNNSAIGSGALSVLGDATLDSTSALQLANAVNLGAQLTLAGNQSIRLIGAVAGSGSLVKNGSGSLLLSGANTYSGGTMLNGGSTTGDTSSLQGAIVNNATLTFEQNSDGSYTGNLTGTGTLNKTGTGQLLLSGNNAITGNTSVQAGTLTVNGVLNSVNVDVASGAKIGGSGQLGGAVQLASGATLVGGGTATPLSVGSLALSSGSNLDFSLGSASSSTTVVNVAGNLTLDGTLNISNAGGFGAGVYQLFRYGGSLTDNGLVYGSLPVSAANLSLQTGLANQVNLLVQGTPGEVQFWNGGTTNPDGTVGGGSGVWGPGTNWTDPTGTQALASNGQFAVFADQGGTVTVQGNQSFTGLQFLVGGYSLVPGAGGSLTPVNGAGGTLAPVRVNAGASTEISVPLVGTGGIEKLDSGILVLTGANTYSGGTTVSGGTLIGNTTSLQGNITDNATLVFQQNTNGQFNGRLSGLGAMAKRGAGTLLLTGDQPFSGAFSVDQGVLQVGSRAARASLGAQVTVANGAGLSGNGSVGSIVNHGVVASGAADGTLSVAGNLTNAADGVLALTVSSSTATPLAVGGTATLGGSLQVNSLAPFTGNTTYSLITAGGGVIGTFSSTNMPQYAFLNTALSYGADSVTLAVSRNGNSFVDVAATGNQRNTASALSRNGAAGAALQGQIVNLSVAGARNAFDSLSGEIHASTASAALEDSRFIREAVNDRMRQPTCSAAGDPRKTLAPTDAQLSSNGCHGEMVGWIRALGAWSDMDGTRNSAQVDRNLGGFMLGTDKPLDDTWRAGMAAGYTRSNLNVHDRHSDASVDSYHLAGYLSSQFDALAVRLGAAYSWHSIETKRDVSVGSYNDRLKADYDARSAQVFGEVGYTIDAAGIAVEPFAGLSYVNYDTDTAKEKGGAGRLKADADQDITYSTLGIRVGKLLTLANGSQLTPRAAIGWRHAYGDTTPDADLTFIDGGASFSTQGVPIAKDSALLEAGVDFQITPAGKLGIGYSGQVSSETNDHAMTISFSQSF
ncbi:autotransporter-associated beta strand repeat-containing protein [Rhodococcus sp. IEGM1300]